MNKQSVGRNVLGQPLEPCCMKPLTGFYRDGLCRTGPDDVGLHTICVQVDAQFLDFNMKVGNDLSTPIPAFGFPGLKPGDQWCLCIERWKEALDAGAAPRVVLEATHFSVLEFVEMTDLRAHEVGQSG